MPIAFIADRQLISVELVSRTPDLTLTVDGRAHRVVRGASSHGEVTLTVDGRALTAFVYADAQGSWVRVAGRTVYLERPSAAAGARGAGRDELRAELPGTVITAHVAAGDEVAAGDPLVTIESMKLQLVVASERAGRIARVAVAAGATFERGALLVAFEPQEKS